MTNVVLKPTSDVAKSSVSGADQSNTVVSFSLATGTHTLEVAYREGGTKLDRLLITDDPSFTPTGTGP